jgi:hypothetical protein
MIRPVKWPYHPHAHLPFRHIYGIHFQSRRRERQFWASISFGLTFLAIRLITHAIRNNVGPVHNVSAGGVHIHHLVWGILLLLLVGYLWLSELGSSADSPRWLARLTAVVFGAAAALTLDEFALWLNLQDVYWEQQGKESLEAVALFAAFLSVGVWGGPFLHAAAHRLAFLVRRARRKSVETSG